MQTGSGKTYTMGIGFKDGCQTGLIPQVMNALFNKIEMLKHQSEFQLHISFIEVYCCYVFSLFLSLPCDTSYLIVTHSCTKYYHFLFGAIDILLER